MQATIDTNENLIKIDFIATGSDLDDGKGKKRGFLKRKILILKLLLPLNCTNLIPDCVTNSFWVYIFSISTYYSY